MRDGFPLRPTLFAFLILVVALGVAQAQGNSQVLVLSGGRLLDGFGGPPLDNARVVVQGDRIVAVGSAHEVPAPRGARLIDTEGMTILPGLWESHGHLQIFGAGLPPNIFLERYPDLRWDVMIGVAEIVVRAGITSFRDLGGLLALQKKLRSDIESGARLGPSLYIAGPTLKQSQKGAGGEYAVTDADQARSVVRRLSEQGIDLISVDGFWELDVLEDLVEEAHGLGLGVDAGVRHPEAYQTAILAGADRLHTVFTTDPLSDYSAEELRLLIRGHRPTGTGPSANILRGPFILPAIEMRRAYVRTLENPERLDHPSLREHLPEQVYDYLRESWAHPSSIPWGIGSAQRLPIVEDKVRRFIQSGGHEQLVPGTDSGSPLNTHSPLPREIANFVEFGLSPMEAIQSATLRAAQMQGVLEEVGTVSVGKRADLIVVDGNPLEDIRLLQSDLVHVIARGRVIR